jgi:hypothetical protein
LTIILYFTAVYLTLTLFYGTMAVVCTIFVLDTYNHDDEDEIPRWLRKLTLNVLAKIACWKGCCRKSKARVNYEPAAPVVIPKLTGKPKRPDSTYKPPLEDDTPPEPKLTWKDIGNIMDKCFLRLFLLMITVTGVVCLSVMAVGSTS